MKTTKPNAGIYHDEVYEAWSQLYDEVVQFIPEDKRVAGIITGAKICQNLLFKICKATLPNRK